MEGKLETHSKALLLLLFYLYYTVKFINILLLLLLLQLDIVGHSGDSAEIPFLSSESPPTNEKEKMDILKVISMIHK